MARRPDLIIRNALGAALGAGVPVAIVEPASVALCELMDEVELLRECLAFGQAERDVLAAVTRIQSAKIEDPSRDDLEDIRNELLRARARVRHIVKKERESEP